MNIKFLILFLSVLFIRINATSQEPDKIIFNNKEYDLLNNPLEKYFEGHPEDHPIYGEKIIYINKNGEKSIPTSTSNYRGYIATFKIENNFLTLVDIEVENMNSDKNEYISVYQKLFGNRKIILNYSGILVVPIGDYLDSDNFGYSSLYSQYILISVQKDSVLKQKTVEKDDFINFKIKQFEAYKNTENYKNDIKEYLEIRKVEKDWELSKENTKNMSKKEIEKLKKEYTAPPSTDYIDNFFFVTKNIDYVIIDY